MPFPRNLDFVGRTDDLERLHATLQQREPVGIRPAGLTGMGGIGKTQLAVEYVYRFKDVYPDGIFWINAAEPLAKGLAPIGSRLRPQVLERPPDEKLRAAFDELKRRPGALLVFDNLEDPAQLARPVGAEASPLTLGCRILFTTRQRELGRFQPIEVSVLPEEPALQLLLRDDSRHFVRDDRHHLERSGAAAVCRMLGYLPLALELASAFLAEWPEVSLADYRTRLEKEGCLPTLDSEVANLAPVNFQPIHEAAVAATLKTQWEALRPGDETARLVYRVAGQFAEAAAIPVATLGLFADVSLAGRPGNPSPLHRALKRLHDVRLIEELHEKRIRQHPLVREFARSLTPEAETPEFRHACARRVAEAFEDFATLENTVQAEGVDLAQQALIAALEFASEAREGATDALALLLRCLAREAHHLRGWHREQEHQPGLLAQQLLFRATTLGQRELADRAEHRLATLARPYLALRWRTYRESPALLRILTGHQDWVNSVALSGDGRYIVSGSRDRTVAVWDLQTGARLHELTGHKGGVNSVA
ncbi:MAG: NB-ARC domain-containing protein, partial [Isosphaeraceae bacterium]